MVNRNITLLYIIKAGKWFMLFMPIIFLFYNENGFSTTELFTLQAVYSVVIAVLEVPSGYFADNWGRKTSLIVGTAFGVAGFLSYSISYSLVGFIVAEALLGIGESLISGADSAILYDTLHEQNRADDYLKIEGRMSATGNIAEAMAGLFVSIIVFRYVRTNFVIQTFISFIAFFAACMLRETNFHSEGKKPRFSEIFKIVQFAFVTEKKLGKIIAFSAFMGLGSLTMAWFAQPVFFEIGLDKSYYGYAWVFLNLLVALGSMIALSINHFFGLRKIFFFLAITMSAGFLAIALKLSYLAFIPMVLLFVIRGIAHPVCKNYINNLTTSEKRATVLSLRSLAIRLLYAGFGPLLGVISDKISLQMALILCATGIFIPSMILAILIVAGNKLTKTA